MADQSEYVAAKKYRVLHCLMYSYEIVASSSLMERETRSSADADKPRDAFRGQSRSPNMVPFDMLGMVSY